MKITPKYESRTRHGLTTSRTYSIWKTMKQRCTNPKNTGYFKYGGVGIELCESWKSFEAFLQDMGECPDGCSIDRIDGTKGYSADNCRWANLETQNANKKKRSGKNKYAGVNRIATGGRYFVRINGKYLGSFEVEEEAAHQYNKIAVLLGKPLNAFESAVLA